jgi:hypothetical protein
VYIRREFGRLLPHAAPSFSDFLLVSLLVWLFATGSGWEALLADGDTGWHIRTGEYVLNTGSVPKTDLFSFSRSGAPWFAWEWLADVIFALLHGQWGLLGVVVVTGVVIVLTAVVLFQHMLWRGANVFAALAVVLPCVGAASIHFLARPHIFTLLLLVVSLWVLERDRRAPGGSVWILVPLSALWANLHGGFLALLACVGLLAAGCAAEALLVSGRNWTAARRYAALTGACSLVTLLNPFGFNLHLHIAHYLRSNWIREAVDEFQSPKFRSENLFQFELLLLAGLLLAGILLSKRRIADALPVLFWAHLSLISVRHVPVFVIVVGPLIAQELTCIWGSWTATAPTKSLAGILNAVARDLAPGFRRVSPWSAVLVLAVLFLTPSSRWPQDFPVTKFPVGLVRAHRDRLASARVFTSDEWADYLIYRGWPRQRVFLDGRSDFYGAVLGKEYLRLVEGRAGWRDLLKKHGFRFVLLPEDASLTSHLHTCGDWRPIAADSGAVLFERVSSASAEVPNQSAMLHR